MNTIPGVNCIQPAFPHCKLQQSGGTKKPFLTLNNIETNKIIKKRKMNLSYVTHHDMLQIKFLIVNILLTLISSSAFNTEKFMSQFLQHLSNETIRIFPAYAVRMPF